MAWNGWIHIQEVLELIEDNGKMMFLSILHDLLEELSKSLHSTIYMKSQHFLSSFLEFLCQHTFVVLRHI